MYMNNYYQNQTGVNYFDDMITKSAISTYVDRRKNAQGCLIPAHIGAV